MGYINGKEILPDELLRQIQKYVDGINIYIPRKEEKRQSWGMASDTRTSIQMRNAELYAKYQKGDRVVDLAEEYHISTQGIYKILSQLKEK